MRARVKHDESTLANVLMDAITATQDDLPDLVAKVRKPVSYTHLTLPTNREV